LVILYQKARRDIDLYLSGQPVDEDDYAEMAVPDEQVVS
jgi:hypothetical protein